MTVATQTQATASNVANHGRHSSSFADSARYRILRRLGPSLKHDMVVNLQAVSMMAEVVSARLEKGAPSPSEFNKSISQINRLARDAVMSCLKVTAWIEPAEDEAIPLREGTQECIALLESNFNFRGFSISNDIADADFEVSHVALRNLLCGSLITLTDSAQNPCKIAVSAEISAGFAVLNLRCVSRENHDDSIPSDVNYPELDWSDLQALAASESVELFRTSEQIGMRIPRLVPTTPLQIVPL
jgi:hypothetical protein